MSNKQTFAKSKNVDYVNDKLYLDAVKLLCFDKPTVVGSFLKYGKNKACDLDMSENLKRETFNDYLKKIILNKKQFILIDAHFNEPYNKLLNIKNKLGYLNGNFKIIDNEDISNDINLLPEELKKSIEELLLNYNNNKTSENYIKIKAFVENKIYPKWTINELNHGELTYYDQIFKINDYNFDNFYIEVMYNDFRLSNYIIFNNINRENGKFKIWDCSGILYDNNLSYFKLLKKFMVSIKWLYYNKLIKEKEIYTKTINLYNTIFNYIDKIGEKYNKQCIIKNKIDVSKVKLLKYNNKKTKYNNNKYDKLINYHTKVINKYNKIYLENMNNINKDSKIFYNKVSSDYSYYLNNYVRIY